jgi:RNA polymerase sigma-70 factor (ECF subfamily)
LATFEPTKYISRTLKPSNFQTEQETIASLQKGSMTAFESLFESYSQKLYRFSYSYLKSEPEAEDVVQEVFLKLWENRSRLKTGTSFQAYLFTITFNSIRKTFNKKAKQDKFRIDLFEFLSVDNTSLEIRHDFDTLLLKLDSLIDQMPDRRREIFVKRKKEGKSVREIAIEMNISLKTVENQITEAMNYLKKEFDNDRISGMLFFYVFVD